MKRKNVIISALVLAIALTGCSGKKVDYNMETENINTKAGSDISAFDDSTKWNDSFSVEISLLSYNEVCRDNIRYYSQNKPLSHSF